MAISYVDGPRFRRSLLAAADWVAAGREELNRINVFPVPDGDTGTNMCLTLRAVASALRDIGDGDNAAPLSLPHVAETMAQASVRGARGNSGMMLSQFLLGFREGIGQRVRAGAAELAHAIAVGFERLRGSLDEPVEGTILTVAREAADEAGRARGERDLRVFMHRIVDRAEAALQHTPELLAALKSAGVVDAGAKGFVRFLDGVKRLIEEGPIAFVTDTACDLPDELVLQYDIKLVPTQLIVDDRPYRDRLELTSAEFFQRLRAGLDATTSQPTPNAFTDAYRDAARAGDHVIAVILSSALSGTFGSAEAAARRFDQGKVTVLDSRNVTLGEGLLVARGVELAAAG